MILLAFLLGCGPPSASVVQDKGSDTMVNLMMRMSQGYVEVKPEIVVSVSGGGSGTGIKSLVDGTTDMANASREMKKEEIAAAEANGVHPVDNIVAHDGLAIYVHVGNPIPSLTFEQLACIYSAEGACDHWKDLGVTLDCGGDDEIIKVGRQNNSGTYEYFRDEVLGKKGRFGSTLDQGGTQQVVDVVSTTKCAIGYGGMGYHSDTARFVCLSETADEPCVEPSIENVASGAYDFSRPLHVYTNGEPTGPIREFLDYARGPAGQKIVLDSGFVPLSPGE